MKKYFKLLILLLVASCAQAQKETESKTYSEDTNRAFEMIERGDSYYLKKPPIQNSPPQIQTSPKKRRLSAKNTEVIANDKKISSPVKPTLKKSQSNSKTDERLIEINQNLAFYCMKNRNKPAYGGIEAKCLEYVNAVMEKCQKKHRTVNSKLLNCIQKKLK